jgi:hypothetical protein
VRGAPFALLPLELSLREVPGYHEADLGGLRILGRRDVTLSRGGSLWIQGGTEVELLLLAAEPLPEPLFFEVRSPAPGNRVRIRLGDEEETFELGPGTESGPVRRVVLEPGGPTGKAHRPGGELMVYRMEVETETGRVEPWTRVFPPPRCPDSSFAYYETLAENFYVGAEITLLSAGGDPQRDVFGVEWRRVRVRSRVPAGATFFADVRLANTSAAAWDGLGAAQVRMSYHWLDAEGRPAGREGLRTGFGGAVPPGGEARVLAEIEAPERPGRYVLVLEPVLEHVAWFSDRGVAPYRAAVTVVPRAKDDGAH